MSASTAIEDYLKAIYKLEDKALANPQGVLTSDLATRLNVAQASVSNMIKRLSELGYID